VRHRVAGGSYVSASDDRLHFGLGPARRVERLQLLFPGGERVELRDLPVDRLLVVRR
jgi:hypothetical protein